MREFSTGATRDKEDGKLDYEGFLHPWVIDCFAEYMHKHRIQADGELRASDNWQKGIPRSAYMKSAWRHFIDVWKHHRGIDGREGMKTAICATMFNLQGMLFEIIKEEKGWS